jgi:predicted permease
MSNGDARTWREWATRLLNTLRPGRSDEDLRKELALHAELAAADSRTGSRPPERIPQVMEALRDQRGLPSVDSMMRDVGYAWRSLRRAPAFTTVAIATLAIGIGANTAIFSVINGVVLRPLEYAAPDRLVFLSTRVPALGLDEFWASPPEYLEFRQLNHSFADVGAYRTGEANVVGREGASRVRSVLVDDHLLSTLGLRAAHGRLITASEAQANGPTVVLLSHHFWQAAFGGQDIVGQTIDVDGARREVIGILEPGADVMDYRTDIWLPFGIDPATWANRASHGFYLIGRLKDEVTFEDAQTELVTLLENWGTLAGVKGTGVAGHVFAPVGKPLPPSVATPGHVLQMVPMKDRVIGGATHSIWMVQAAVGLVLLIVGANIVGLLLARSAARRHEFAVRTALGASRARLVQLFVAEGVLLSIAGAVAGLLLGRLGLVALLTSFPESLPRTASIAFDGSVWLFAFGIAGVSGVLFGIAPVMHARIEGIANALRAGHARVAGPVGHYLRRGLVVAQVALAAMVIVGAGLLVRSVENLSRVEAGFERSRLVTFGVTLPAAAYPTAAARMQVYQRILDALRALPGVESASGMSGLPLSRGLDARGTEIEGYAPGADGRPPIIDYYQNALSDYFTTMRIPIVRGRGFEPADAASTGLVGVVNEALARTYFPGTDPIGRRLRPCCGNDVPWVTIIGVAGDVTQASVETGATPELYYFTEQTARRSPPPAAMHFVLRTVLPVSSLMPAIKEAVATQDAAIPVVKLREMEEVFANSIRRPLLLARLLTSFAAIALLLAAVGLYGILSYLIVERRREIGIRMALGATRARTLMAVMTQGLVLAAIGLLSGLTLVLALSRVFASLLFRVEPADAVTLTAAGVIVALTAVLASGVPAWRASRQNVTAVIRES